MDRAAGLRTCAKAAADRCAARVAVWWDPIPSGLIVAAHRASIFSFARRKPAAGDLRARHQFGRHRAWGCWNGGHGAISASRQSSPSATNRGRRYRRFLLDSFRHGIATAGPILFCIVEINLRRAQVLIVGARAGGHGQSLVVIRQSTPCSMRWESNPRTHIRRPLARPDAVLRRRVPPRGSCVVG